jgi:8-oxo-dGTP pyrophosphatase MutT (NUDIX family)
MNGIKSINMDDLTIFVNDIKLNIRVAVIIETDAGYIFEKDPKWYYYFIVGGRIKINETSSEAAQREIYEELGIELKNFILKAIAENFFEENNIKYQEICFYYRCKINGTMQLPEKYYALTVDEIRKNNIRPIFIYNIISSKDNDIMHIILRE